MQYRRFCETLNDKGILIPVDANPLEFVNDSDKDYYLSVYKYTEDQKRIFDEKNTVSGIDEVTTDKIVFDFDCESDPGEARKSAVALIKRLKLAGVDPSTTTVAFSGCKGFAVEVNITEELTPTQHREIALSLAGDLPYFDPKMYNANRIFRIIGTKHPLTGLYKTSLSLSQLENLYIENIKTISTTNQNSFRYISRNQQVLPEEIRSLKQKKVTASVPVNKDFERMDFTKKPKFLSNCRWALQNGYFESGTRSSALLCLASTYKNLGFDEGHVYRMLKATAEKQALFESSKIGKECDRFDDKSIWNTIVKQVFSPTWNNGQFTCRDDKDDFLYPYCQSLGRNKCNHKEEDSFQPRGFIDIVPSFKDYVKNIEKGIVKTGLTEIDNNLFISSGANVGIIGSPGSGKTSLALNVLNNTSKAGVKSVFASLDMHQNRMFEKVLYKISGERRDYVYDLFKHDKEEAICQKLKEEFGNVNFFNKSCPTVEDVRNYILSCQDKCGEKIKFVMLDYFERISSDVGDDTAASKKVAGQLQDLVNELDIALITLVQPNKNAISGGPDSPIYDYTKIKGSSYVYQAFRIIMSLWRPYYNPKTFADDRYMQMAVLKNDLGELNEFVFGWNGPKGEIYELADFQKDEFYAKLKNHIEDKNKNSLSLNF